MIILEDDVFILKIGENKYYFQGEKYESLILFLTNPTIELPNTIEIDDDIKNEDDKYKAKVYCDFINGFIEDRKEIDKEFISKKDDEKKVTKSEFEK